VTNIFVGNLSFSTSEDAIRQMFETHGSVERVTLVTDRDTGRSRGFGFVEMSDDAQATKAIAALNGMEMEGRALNVNLARPREPRGNSFGRQREGFNRQRREPRW
jgi:RNA recognition motif-containing protein